MLRKNAQSGNTSHHRVAPPHVLSKRIMEANTNEGSSTTSDSASTINKAFSYDYLKQFYDDPGGKNCTFV